MNYFGSTKISTKGLLNWKPEAEGERQQMSKLYTDLLGIEDAVSDNEFIIMGRKGAGKSAYAVHLQTLSTDPNNMIACESIDSQDIRLEKLINEVDDGTTQYTALLEWLILYRLVKLILKTQEGTNNKNYKNLNQFFKTTSGHVEFTKDSVSEIIRTREFNITPLQAINLKAGKQITNKGYKVSFYSMIDTLRDAVCETLEMEVYSKYRFYVLIDDLDVDFSLKEEAAKKRLLALLRVVCKYNTDYLRNTSSKIIVFVRDDIATKLSAVGADSQKMLDSYGFTINWYQGIEERDNLLYKMINHRLKIAFEEKNIPITKKTPWDMFASESYSQFKRLLDYTFYLPRDIIRILYRSKNKNWSLPLCDEEFAILLEEYSPKKYEEICNELSASFDSDEIEDIKKALFKISRDIQTYGPLSYTQIMQHLERVNLSEREYQILIEHDILVRVDKHNKGNLLYSYREKKTLGSHDDYLYVLPKVLYEYFYTNN